MQQLLDSNVEIAIAFLEERGFVNKKQNIRLLKLANFNPEIVADFLSAKKALLAAKIDDANVVIDKNAKGRFALHKQIYPELFANFLEAKKTLHGGDSTNEVKLKLTKEERLAKKQGKLEGEEVKTKPKLTKEERLALKEQRLKIREERLGAKAVKNEPISEEEKLARKEQRLKMREERLKTKKLQIENSQAENQIESQPAKVKLTKEERFKLKAERIANRKITKQAKSIEFPSQMPPRVKTVFIDASSLFLESSQVIENTRTLLQNSANMEKCTILYEDSTTSMKEEKLVVAMATPIFSSTMEAVKCLMQNVQDKKTCAVISGNKEWIMELRKEGVHTVFMQKTA